MTSNEFSNIIQNSNESNDTIFRMATVTGTSGGVHLKFYGETSARSKTYKRLSSYSPTVGDVVICAKLNGSYTVLGKVV